MNSNMIGNKDKVCTFNAKQKGIHVQLLELMSTSHFCHFVLFFKRNLSYRYLAGSSFWIKVKTSCFIGTQKNKLNLKSGNPKITKAHSPLYMQLIFSLNKNAWQGTGKIPYEACNAKRKKSQGKRKKPIKYAIKANGKKPTLFFFFFFDISQPSKSYCQEQLRAGSAHVQPDWFICFRFLSYFLLKLGLETSGRRVSNESKTTLCLLGSSILN